MGTQKILTLFSLPLGAFHLAIYEFDQVIPHPSWSALSQAKSREHFTRIVLLRWEGDGKLRERSNSEPGPREALLLAYSLRTLSPSQEQANRSPWEDEKPCREQRIPSLHTCWPQASSGQVTRAWSRSMDLSSCSAGLWESVHSYRFKPLKFGVNFRYAAVLWWSIAHDNCLLS